MCECVCVGGGVKTVCECEGVCVGRGEGGAGRD